MAVAFRAIGETDFTTATASPAVNKPTSPSTIQDGDMMLMFLVTNTTTTVADGPIAGWTKLFGANFASDGTYTIWYKVHDGDGSSWTMSNIFSGAVRCNATVIAYSGVDPYAVPQYNNTTTTGTAVAGPSVTPDYSNSMFVQFLGTDPGTGTYTGSPDTSPTGTERRDTKNSGGSNYEYVAIQEYLQGAKAALSLDYTALTSDDYGHAQVVLKPAGVTLTAVQDAYCTTQSDNVVVQQAAATNLVVQDAFCTSAVEPAGVLAQVHNLVVQDAFCTSQTDAIVVTQQHNLVVGDAYCTSQADNVVVVEVAAINLVVQDAHCTTQTDAISIAVIYILVVNDAYCITQSDSVTLGGEGQRLFPIADVTDGNWTNQSGSQVNLYESVNEETPNDSDYIQSEYNPTTSPVVVKLEPGVDPGSSIGHVLRYRLEKYPDGSLILSLVVQLRQAYVNESNLGILIAEWTDNDVGDGIELVERPLTTGQADIITDYTDLYVRMVAD